MNLSTLSFLLLALVSAEGVRQPSAIPTRKVITRKTAAEVEAEASVPTNSDITTASSSNRNRDAGEDDIWKRIMSGTAGSARKAPIPPPVAPVGQAGKVESGDKFRESMRKLSQELGFDAPKPAGAPVGGDSFAKLFDSPSIRQASQAFAEALKKPTDNNATDADGTPGKKSLRELSGELMKNLDMGEIMNNPAVKDIMNSGKMDDILGSDAMKNLDFGSLLKDFGRKPAAAGATGEKKADFMWDDYLKSLSKPKATQDSDPAATGEKRTDFMWDDYLKSLSKPKAAQGEKPKMDIDSLLQSILGDGAKGTAAAGEKRNWFDDFDFDNLDL